MSITLSGTTLTFNDSSFQTTAPKATGMYVSGGIYLGIFSTYHLIVSTFNYETTRQWKTTNTSTSGTSSTTDGLANTNAMNNTTHPAAYYCATSVDGVGGVSDWYLPARDELNIVYRFASTGIVGNYACANYWSSTEYSAGNSWYQNFLNGAQYDAYLGYSDGKTFTYYVRPVRRLSL